MTLETRRLILRPWQHSDAEDLYRYASSPDVGPIAGWPVHTSVENSLEIIRGVLSKPETYAVILKEAGHAVGSVGLMIGKNSSIGIPNTEGEIGYWIGVPFWGQGLIPEAVNELLRYGFEDLGLEKIWCGYFEGNKKSKRVQEKCGFIYHHTDENILWETMNDIRTNHISCQTKEQWICAAGKRRTGGELTEKFEFRSIHKDEADQAAVIEQICFPPNEACSEKSMKERVAKVSDLFLVAVDKNTGKIAGFLNGVATSECVFRDEFFTDVDLHDPAGKTVMLLGLDVLPEYRGQGLAREIVRLYSRRERENGRKMLVLTCLQSKVEMYQKMGFQDRGIANSSWGGEEWHEMSLAIDV